MSLRKEMERLVDECEANGWIVQRDRKHYKLTPPGGGNIIFASKTPSDTRAIANTRALIRRTACVPTLH